MGGANINAPSGVRTSARYTTTSSARTHVPRDRDSAMINGDDMGIRSSRRAREAFPPPPPPPHARPLPPPPTPPQPRRTTTTRTRAPTATGSAPESSASLFLGRNYFHCPELDQRMKKYLVRLANETANHLIRDTLEPEHANLVWRPMATVKGIDILRGYEQPHASATPPVGNKETPKSIAALKDATCLRGVAQVSASIEEFAMLFKLDTNKQLAEHGLLFNPDLLDMTTLYSLVQPSGDHPRRYVGIKWCLVQSPSRIFRNRDFCYLECQKEFRDAHGRRGWVRSMHSIKMPCCPSLEKSHGVVRASLYRCGLIAVETDKPGVLDTTYTIEMDLKGHFPEIFQPKFLSQRIAALASIDKFLQQQRLSSSPLLGDLDIPKTKVKGSCHFCFREFSTFGSRRFVCRKCGECVCRHCSDDWQLDVPVVGTMKVRICTVCSAEARTCHATPLQPVVFDVCQDFGSDDASAISEQFYQHHNGVGRLRRSNSMPEHDEYGESPFLRTAQEPTRSMFRSASSIEPLRSQEMEPSEYFARQQQRYQQQLQQQQQQKHHYQQHHQQKYQPTRESQAYYRESDFTSEIRDFTHGEIRGTADLTNLWTQEDANYFGGPSLTHQQPRGEPSNGRRVSRRTLSSFLERETSSPEPQNYRSRIPSDVSGRSVFRESALPDADYARDGPLPPSTRYAVVDDRLERANSFDAGRQFEERQRRPTQPATDDYAQSPNAYYGNSRRSPKPLNGSYSPPGSYLQPSPAPSPIYQYHGQQSQSSNAQSQSQSQSQPQSQPMRQTQARYQPSQRPTNENRQSSRLPPQPQAPLAAPAPRNIALAFAQQPQAQPTAPAPRNVALAFARQAPPPPPLPPQSHASNTTPRNIALAFATQAQQSQQSQQSQRSQQSQQSQRSHASTTSGQATRNVALAFATQQLHPPHSPESLESPTFQYTGEKVRWSQMVDEQPEPPHSPDFVGATEPVEYIETDNGEWIASDRWEKGALLNSAYLDLDTGDGEPLESRPCETCGATQYVHEGVVEATCDCDLDDELEAAFTRPSTQTGQSSRDESRVSFRVEANIFDDPNEPEIDPWRPQSHDDDSFHGGTVKLPVDMNGNSEGPNGAVLPLLVDQLSQHSLRSSFHHT